MSPPRRLLLRASTLLLCLVCLSVRFASSSATVGGNWPTVLEEYDITTPIAEPGETTAWTVSGLEALTVAPTCVYYDDTALVMRANTTGAHTESVHRTRTEAKSSEVFYLESAAVHDVSISARMESINYFGKVVILQMHVDDGDDPTFKGFWNSGKLTAGVRTWADDTEATSATVLSGVPIGQDFVFGYRFIRNTSAAANASLFTVYASSGGTSVSKDYWIVQSRALRPNVIHFGVYNQINMGLDGEPAGDNSRIRIANVTVYHGPLSGSSSSSSSTGAAVGSTVSSSSTGAHGTASSTGGASKVSSTGGASIVSSTGGASMVSSTGGASHVSSTGGSSKVSSSTGGSSKVSSTGSTSKVSSTGGASQSSTSSVAATAVSLTGLSEVTDDKTKSSAAVAALTTNPWSTLASVVLAAGAMMALI